MTGEEYKFLHSAPRRKYMEPLLTLPAPSIPPPLTLPPHQLITTSHLPLNISPPNWPPFHCTPIPHHSRLSLTQPAHPQLLLNSFIRLKHSHSHASTLSYFPRIVIPPQHNPTPHTPLPRMSNSERHKEAQLPMTIIFFMESDAQCTTTWWQ